MTKDDILAVAGDPPFSTWLGFELEHEDVATVTGLIIEEDVKGDSGGRTFAGIDQASHPNFNFDHPTPAGVVLEYQKDWVAARGDQLPDPVGMTVANFVVNMGPEPATRLLQEALGVEADGDFGPVTLAAARATPDPRALAHAIVDLATARYQSLAQQNTRLRRFLAGWVQRDKDLSELDEIT